MACRNELHPFIGSNAFQPAVTEPARSRLQIVALLRRMTGYINGIATEVQGNRRVLGERRLEITDEPLVAVTFFSPKPMIEMCDDKTAWFNVLMRPSPFSG